MSQHEARCEFCSPYCYGFRSEECCSYRLLFKAIGTGDTGQYPWDNFTSGVLENFLASLKSQSTREEDFWSAVSAVTGLERHIFADYLESVSSLCS
jgi:hypothetical protein